jgi:two-component system cell cycle sensor histidine kinase/response regulator CckA
LRLSVTYLGDKGFMWRLEEFVEKSAQGRGPDSFGLPMVIANRAGVVLFSNESLRRLIGLRPRRLDQIFFDGPLVEGEEVSLRTTAGPMRAVYAEFDGHGERREIFLLPVPVSRINPGDEPLEHVPVALARFSAEGSVITANATARRLLNLEPGEDAMFHTLFEGLGRPVNEFRRAARC